ncbi:MAG: LysR family transcriptional regulator [Oscillospiraceae bacterium]|nr:LysR family transcriptional regulator [Oscillospiraceae bacterium]
MDLEILKNFLVVAQEENITRASELLHISQPTLSRQIQSLEDEFGARLFVRDKKRTTLTSQGLLLQRRSVELLDMYRKTQIEVQSEPGVITGDINVACIYAKALNTILDLGKEVASEHPGTRLIVSNGDMYTVRELVQSGQVDFGLIYAQKEGDDMFERFEVQENVMIHILAPEGHPLTRKDHITYDDLKDYPLILHKRFLGSPIPGRHEIDQTKYNITGAYTTPVGAVLMVNSGYGIALVSDSNIEVELGHMVLKDVSLNTNLSAYLIWKKNSAMPVQSEYLLNRLIEHFSSKQ